MINYLKKKLGIAELKEQIQTQNYKIMLLERSFPAGKITNITTKDIDFILKEYGLELIKVKNTTANLGIMPAACLMMGLRKLPKGGKK